MILTKNTEELQQLVQQHVAADQVVQGLYWDAGNSKGCFIGCLNHSNLPDAAEQRFGLPIMIQRIAESIFEALPPNEARAFFAALPDAVACDGKNLTLVGWQFLAAELRALPPQPDEIQAVIDPVITGLDLLASREEWPEGVRAAAVAVAWGAASAAARAAARDAARDAARGAVWAAAAAWDAATAAAWDAAWDAASAAASAAAAARDAAAAWDADWDAASAAARTDARRRQRDCLLELIATAPIVSTIEND